MEAEAGGDHGVSRVGWSHPLFVTQRNGISSVVLKLTTFRSIDQQQVEKGDTFIDCDIKL